MREKEEAIASRRAEKTLVSVRLPALLAAQVKIVAAAQGGLSKFVTEVLHQKMIELKNDPDFMEDLYRDE